MDSNDNSCIKFRAQGACNAIEILAVGAIGLIFIMCLNLLRPGEISIVEIFLVSVCLAAIFIGYLKTQEPYYSLILTNTTLIYQHKYGFWQLHYKNMGYCGVPETADCLAINALGIKLNNVVNFLPIFPHELQVNY
jgi:hypothetical protein